jgi:Tol biopolymer transport system component
MRRNVASIVAALALAACAQTQATQSAAPTPTAPAVEYTLETIDIETGARRAILASREEIGAPNWSRDGRELYYNSGRELRAISVEGGAPRVIHTVSGANGAHDHGPSPDGTLLAVSDYADDRVSFIHLAPLAGGASRKLTQNGPSYFHGWSPDGARIAFTAVRGDDNYDVYEIDVATGAERRLTNSAAFDDGADYAPDGTMYFGSSRSGAMRIWKMDPNGENQTQVTNDAAFQDWFPHPSPDGRWLVWLSFPGDVTGLESRRAVTLRLMPRDGAAPPRTLATLTGGHGSINAPPWSPDSRAVAFVSHRVLDAH